MSRTELNNWECAIESLWRDDLTEEQIQEAERNLQKWFEKCKAESEG